jgi:hypothetical protein
MAPKKLESNFLLCTLGKLLVFLVITHIMQTFFIMKKLGKGCLGSFGTHSRYFHYFLWEKQSCLTTSPREQIEFVSHGPTVLGLENSFIL